MQSEDLIIRRTAADTNGEYVEFDLVLHPDTDGTRKQSHPRQTERFEILAGTIKFRLGRKTVVARAGDVVVVPPGKKHRLQNAGVTLAQARVQMTPAHG